MRATAAVEYRRTGITGYPTDDDSGRTTGAALALVTAPGEAASPPRSADDVATAFLAGYGPATREAYAPDLRTWGDFLADLGVEVPGERIRRALRPHHAVGVPRLAVD